MEPGRHTRLQIGEWLVEPARGRISREGKQVLVRPREMDVLLYLARRPGEVVSAEDILENVWKGVTVAQDSVYFSISQLRKALGDDIHEHEYIETTPKRGYQLVAAIETLESPEETAASRPARSPSILALAGLAALTLLGAALIYRVPSDQKPPTAGDAGALIIEDHLRPNQGGASPSSIIVAVDPRSHIWHASTADKPIAAVIVDLAFNGFAPGDVLEFEIEVPLPGLSLFSCDGPFQENGKEKVYGVFSSTSVMLSQSEQYRFPDAIKAGTDVISGYAIDGQATDIPDDFSLKADPRVEIPQGARYLMLSVSDTFYADNCVPGNLSPELPFGALMVTISVVR
jgi:DNA-binding winged helix-turn-helix (wHTH) protein